MIAIAIAVLLALGGGTSYVAEGAVPGDALYSVKTMVNENVRGSIAVGAEAHAKWQAALAERRLAEAEKLSKAGKLKDDVAADLGAQIQSHAEAALAAAADLRAKGDAGAAAEVESEVNAAVEAHAGLTNAIAQADEHATATLQAVLQKIETRVKTTVGANANTNANAEIRVGDMDRDGRPDSETSETEGSASVKSEGKAGINGSGASVNASGTIKVGI
jgi:hypothetical protein